MNRWGAGPVVLWALLILAASARIILQLSLMPPYAGLDEIYHMARLSFVAQEKRNPTSTEPSIPEVLQRSIEQRSNSVPAFGLIGMRWPDVVASGARLPLEPESESPHRYLGANYEAQQPSFYYSLGAIPIRALAPQSTLTQLRAVRLMAAMLALVVVVATAWIGERLYGLPGLVASAMIVSMPTWLTLVMRAGNDAMACALLALALCITVSAPRRRGGAFAEGVLWGAALATKLYVWPAAIVLPLFWRAQRADRRRILVVIILSAGALALTIADLHSRTRNPLGTFAFDPVSSAATGSTAAVAIDYAQMVRIFAATLVWTSGQHWNALTGVGMALYVLPILALLTLPLIDMLRRPGRDRQMLLIVAASVVAYLAAQTVNAAGYIRFARLQGASLPSGGKEGWYLYAFVPILVGLGLSGACARLRRGTLVFLVMLVLFWDLRIHEGALFRDWAGVTSAAHRSLLFRWGASSVHQSIYYAPLAAGPFASAAAAWRLVHVMATLALLVLVIRDSRRELAPVGAIENSPGRSPGKLS
ncbi:MAG TPA: hypothetical protein VHL58_06585 [Thermoanaerobaculia bacterium]|nr:hypothetical protein [Thermoanaerobaculia bacterium]